MFYWSFNDKHSNSLRLKMSTELVALFKKELDAMHTSLTEAQLDMLRTILADTDTKYNHILSQINLLLGKSDSGGADKKAPKRVVASTESCVTANGTSGVDFPNMAGLSEKNINAIKGLKKRGMRNAYLKIRCAVDLQYYTSSITEDFRNEHENSTKAEKAKKVGQEALREYVATQWWDLRKDDKTFKDDVQKEMKEWIDKMHETTTVAASAMDNE